MSRLPFLAWLMLSLAWLPLPARAQHLFEESRASLSTPGVALTDSGATIRGGINFSPFVPAARTETLLRGNANIGSLCGFDIGASMVEYFETLPDVMLELAQPLLVGAAFVFLCQSAPSLCDFVKHLHQWANVALRARFAQCQQIMSSAMSAGVALRNDAQGLCIREAVAAGIPAESAFHSCVNGSSLIPGPNDLRASTIEVVADTLESTGVDPATQALLRDMVGELTLSTDGSVFSRVGQKPQERFLVRYMERKEEVREGITTLVADMTSGSTPAPVALQALSVPGAPLSTDALEAIVLERDPAMRDFHIQKLSGAIALVATVWEILELEDTLDSAIAVSELTPSQREALQERHANLRKQVGRIEKLKQVIEAHYSPQIEGLLHTKAVRTREAATVATRAASQERLPSRFPETGQNIMGYVQ